VQWSLPSINIGYLPTYLPILLTCHSFITINHHWRVIYQVASALIGAVLLVAFFTFPETAYIREIQTDDGQQQQQQQPTTIVTSSGKSQTSTSDIERAPSHQPVIPPAKKSYLSTLSLFPGTSLTNEPLLKLVLRPLGLICLPPVLWSALCEAATIGFLVAMSSNIEVAFEATYHFESWQVGLCFLGAILGSLLGIPAGGHLGDKWADRATQRNKGVRDPEMRLPSMIPCLFTAPLGLVLYGVGIERRLHWMCPTIGLGLLNFGIVQGTNVCLVYVIDAYRPVAGEITLAVMGFKSVFGFLLSFYTNTWVRQSGYLDAYGTMAAISAVVLLGWIPLYYWGKTIRHSSWQWPVVSYIHWHDDREVGE